MCQFLPGDEGDEEGAGLWNRGRARRVEGRLTLAVNGRFSSRMRERRRGELASDGELSRGHGGGRTSKIGMEVRVLRVGCE